MLNKNLPKMLKWLRDTYTNKFEELIIVTNGTILPSGELLDAIRETNTEVDISDYSLHASYKEKLECFKKILIENSVPYVINQEMEWKDFYFPRKKQGAVYSNEYEHMRSCNPIFRGLNDKKFYYCHIIWSAVQAGIWKEEPRDYIELDKVNSNEEKRRLLAHELGFIDEGSVSLCRVCGGCGDDNQCIIKAGIQEA